MKYDLVFEGGGAKGMVFVGACEELFGRGHTFDRLIGTSAGAITATLLAAGYAPGEMLDALVEKDSGGRPVFTSFMGPPAPFDVAELRASATRHLLEGVDFTFVPDFLEKKLHEKLVDALAANEAFRHVLGSRRSSTPARGRTGRAPLVGRRWRSSSRPLESSFRSLPLTRPTAASSC
jgi:NTE family protein